MRLLLFLISLVFSLIFYIFHLLSKGEDLFGGVVNNLSTPINSIMGSFLIEVIFFILLGIFFVIIFTPLGESKKKLEKKVLYNMLFFLLLLFPLYLKIFNINKFIIVILIIFIFGEISFSFLSNIRSFKAQKLKIRYLGIFLNYFSALMSIYYLSLFGTSYYLYLIILYCIFLNYSIHKKFGNYISLFLSFFLLLFLGFHIFLTAKEFYMYFINY